MNHPIDPHRPAKGQDWAYTPDSTPREERRPAIVLDVHEFAQTTVVYVFAGLVYAESLASFLKSHSDPRWGAPLPETCYFVDVLTPKGVQPGERFADAAAAWAYIDQADNPDHVGVSKATIEFEPVDRPSATVDDNVVVIHGDGRGRCYCGKARIGSGSTTLEHDGVAHHTDAPCADIAPPAVADTSSVIEREDGAFVKLCATCTSPAYCSTTDDDPPCHTTQLASVGTPTSAGPF